MTSSWRFTITVSMLLSTATAARYFELPHRDKLRVPLASVSGWIGGWELKSDELLQPALLTKLQPTAYVARTYAKDSRNLNLFVAYYAQQKAGETMHSPRVCLPGSGWEIRESGTVRVPVENGFVTVNRTGIQKVGERQLVLYWYQSGARVIASEYAAKAQLFADAIFQGRTSGSLVRIVVADEPGSTERAVGFASQLIPELIRCWGK